MQEVGDPAPHALKALSEDEIMRYWTDEKVTVSVLCSTFEHVEYIRDAINGFLAQRANFRYEVLIRDDCSSDGTQEVIKEYKEKYPNIVRMILEEKNKWPAVKALPTLLANARGKYIALCEGDDYWIDERKLQKQVDFLEANDKVSLLKTGAVAIENSEIFSPLSNGGTRTFMFPAKVEIPEELASRCYFGDILLQALLRRKGRVHAMEDVTAVWRKHPGGVCGGNLDNNVDFLNVQRSQTNFWIAQYFYKHNDVRLARHYLVRSLNSLIAANRSDRASVIALLYLDGVMGAAKRLAKQVVLKFN